MLSNGFWLFQQGFLVILPSMAVALLLPCFDTRHPPGSGMQGKQAEPQELKLIMLAHNLVCSAF